MSKPELIVPLPVSPLGDPTTQLIKELTKQRGSLKDFNQVQNKLDEVLPESQSDEQLDERESFECKYYGILAQANCILDIDCDSPNVQISEDSLSVHHAETCKFGPCRKCNAKHNTIIHREHSRSPTEGRRSLLPAHEQGECSSDPPQLVQRTQMQSYSSQMVGPAIQGDLFSILLRFRENTYIACADIEKMYRQVLVVENQRDLQLILWRSNPDAPIESYRLNTVTYGTASAPFLSVRCLRQLAIECNDLDVKRIITQDFYVDDMITGSNNKHELLELCEKTTKVLASGCFPLRKWLFNFERDNVQSETQVFKNLSLGEQSQSKTLGLSWLSHSDQLNYQTKIDVHPNKITKRGILSIISQIFDPLGLLSATIISVKILLQKLWLLKIDWDTELPHDVSHEFNKFLNSLNELCNIRIPRHAFARSHIRSELHIFTDASQVAYGACAYVRTFTQEGVTIRLLCAKGKVAPLKTLTVPRLELCGAITGARLAVKIIESLRCQFDDVILWSDSTIVLGWLRMAPYQLKTYVQNRVVEVQELTRDFIWRHVATHDNPADLVSRGTDLSTLKDLGLWWEGPSFLHDPNFTSRSAQVHTTMINADNLPEVLAVQPHPTHHGIR
ncbi:uncharacterized protein LOC125072209 [Vanessa atalanta]|uniref:uncharacterized protein LOC125072209 n=1 Tax=Vanessa atalanta TaxID=42275 RepID=UPI001FCD5702|nr:uncharacterized protein LOC125072209 [Vanessa atalanta]